MPELPVCPRFAKQHGCPRSDPVLLSEDSAKGTAWLFRCRSCQLVYVITKPVGKAAALYEKSLGDARRRTEELKARDRRPKHFDLGGK